MARQNLAPVFMENNRGTIDKLLKLKYMSDLPMLITSSALCFLVILLTFKVNTRVALVHAIIFTGYSTYFYHGLFYDSREGTGLVWLFYIMIFTLLHFVILGVYLIAKYVAWRKSKR